MQRLTTLAVTGYDVYRWTDAAAGSGYTEPPVRIARRDHRDDLHRHGRKRRGSVQLSRPRRRRGHERRPAFEHRRRHDAEGRRHAHHESVHGHRELGRPRRAPRRTGFRPAHRGQDRHGAVGTDGTTWTDAGTFDASSPDGFSVKPTRKTWYRLYFAGDGTHLEAYSSPSQTVTPRVKLGRPVAPKAVKKGSKFTAYGSLVPRHASGTKVVRIKCYQKVSGQLAVAPDGEDRRSQLQELLALLRQVLVDPPWLLEARRRVLRDDEVRRQDLER